MRAASSGTTASERISQPAFCAASFNAGPPKSLYSPALARSEIVTIPTTICIFAATDQHRRNTDSSACQLCLSVYICVSLWLLFCFCNQPYVRNSHLFVDSLAHVVDRKKSDGDASERLHFDAGLGNSVRGAFYLRALVRRDDV